MTAAKTAAAPSTYRSGHCAAGFHDRCRGAYAGVECTCAHHAAPPEPDPLPLEPVRPSHCPTCTCGAPR